MFGNKTECGIAVLGTVFALAFLVIIAKYFTIAANPRYVRAAAESKLLTVNIDTGEGNVYDRNMCSLINCEYNFVGAAVPSMIDFDSVYKLAEDKDYFTKKYKNGEVFTFECTDYAENLDGLTVFRVPVRYGENQIAQHILGYTSQGVGVSGIEYAYNKLLRGNYGKNSVTYSTDGFGNVLEGDACIVERCGDIKAGVVTTIDAEIQKICEESGNSIKKGAISVAEIETGDIIAMASFPTYSVYDLEAALNSNDSPLINRNLYAYSVGSIFKLVTACQAIKENYGGYRYECSGFIDVSGHNFNCHRLDGHGVQDMTAAMTNSCNTYFINLSRWLDISDFRETAFNLGFGREIHLCSGITAAAGILPTEKELNIPAELANFSFGQGKLSASPLQLLQLTCAIAGEGKMPVLRIIKGLTEDGSEISNQKKPQYAYVIERKTANLLRDMMLCAVENNEASNAKPKFVTAGAKTSTAQTGKYDENGTEQCNAWITGFFPAENPIYAVTVLVENGGYGNDSAAPVFREIADRISVYAKLGADE